MIGKVYHCMCVSEEPGVLSLSRLCNQKPKFQERLFEPLLTKSSCSVCLCVQH